MCHCNHIFSSFALTLVAADQYKWLEIDLANVDRSITPWLVAAWYPPWYSTYKAHYREAECMKMEMEELLYSYGVDIVFNGHVRVPWNVSLVNYPNPFSLIFRINLISRLGCQSKT